MSVRYLSSCLLVVLFLLSGCSSGNSNNSNTQINDTITGHLVDSNVSGVEYINNDTNIKGFTDINGSFTYVKNTTLTFKIGGLKLGELNTTNIKSDNIVYPTDLVGLDRNETNNPKVTKLIRMLQSLDFDNDPYNGIDINSTLLQQLANSSIDFTLDSTTLEDINTTLNDLNKTLLSQDEALIHYEYTLQSNGISVDTIAPFTPINLTTLPEEIITDSFDLNISGERGTTIFVNDLNTTNKIDINGSATITLNTPGANGNKHFSIKLKDDAGFFSEDLNITLFKNVNIAPVATYSSFTTDEDVAFSGTLTATDENNDSLTYSKVLDSNGTLSLESNGSFIYTPNLNFYGDDSFSYIVSDEELNSTTKIVSITIASVVDPISGQIYSKTITEDSELTFSSTIINDSFVNPDNLPISKIKVISLPTDGALKLSSTNITLNQEITSSSFANITYTPTADYSGSDSFKISAYDGTTWSDNTTVNITITAVNDAPTITTDASLTASENQTDAFTITATDPDDTTLTYSISGSDYSKFNVNSQTGVVTFKTAPDYETKSSYSINIKANDGTLTTSKSVIITIINEADVDPTLGNNTFTVNEIAIEDYVIGTLTISNAGDSDITAITLSGEGSDKFSVSTAGVITLNSAQRLDYETQGTYNLTATATNGAGDSTPSNVIIYVNDNYFIHKNQPTITKPTSIEYYGTAISINDSDKIVAGDNNAGEFYIFDSGDSTPDTTTTLANNAVGIQTKVIIGDKSYDIDKTNEGIAYIYDTDGTNQQTIVNPNDTAEDMFGSGVAIDSTQAIVGLEGKSSNIGAAYYYDDINNLASNTIIANPNNAAGDYFGSSVAISGDYIVVGAQGYDSNKGRVYVFKKTDLVNPIKTLSAVSSSANDYFGSSVAISGDYIVVGAKGVSSNTGEIYIFKINSSTDTVTQLQRIEAYNKATSQYFGTSVSINSDRDIIVGAPGSGSDTGTIYIYEED